jgi:hypothetical protein
VRAEFRLSDSQIEDVTREIEDIAKI